MSSAAAGLTTWTYDANGNQLTIEVPSGDLTTNTWDYENRLTRVEHSDGSITTYAYDPDNHRVEKDDGVDVVRFVYDGNNILQERSDLGTLEAAFTYIPQPYAQVIIQHRDTESSFYHPDGINNIRQLTDETAAETNRYDYDAWLQIRSSTGTVTNPQTGKGLFSAYRREDDGLYGTHNRFYEADSGRWKSADPAEADLNLYRYVNNNPINNDDPSGLQRRSGTVEVLNPRTGALETVPSQLMQEYLQANPGARVVGEGPHAPKELNAETAPVPELAPFLPPKRRVQKLEMRLPPRISVSRVNKLVEAGLAKEFVRLGSVNARAVVVPIKLSSGTEKYLVLQYVPPGLTSGTYFRIASERLVPSTMSMEQAADTLVFSPAEVGSAVAAEAQLTFVLHVLPLGAATDYTDQGDYTEAAISIAGDAAELLTGPLALAAKTAEGARRIRRTGIVLEASVGVYRAGQGVTDLYNEKYARGAGELGEALLRLFGVSIHLRSARRPKADLPEALPIASRSSRRRLFANASETGTTLLPAGAGETDKFGNVLYSTLGSADDVALARYHESVHSFLSPKFKLFRELRADFGMAAYNRSSTLRYIEEALAESYAQLRVNGIRGLPTGIKFPIKEGYVTIQALAAEGAVGTVVIGGVTYYVFHDSE
ncbi:RHS repeat domain-containing protein [Maioricimonas rarisocia]|uniref:RHS repeat domain-containing protein n=1 Tax=Maioricimonas rarisocia TaxID=2528026 RepID=UPI0018D215FB|nr:RHS repeat-associated core domain-containing protein [Maioricimonas rarisocia]